MPVLRTRKAELFAYSNLSDQISSQIFPVFELTRGRRTKSDGQGDISKNISQIKSLMGNKWFGLDLTSTEEQQNTEITTMLSDGENAFDLWVNFVNSLGCSNVIPVIHYDDFYPDLITKQVAGLRNISKYLLLRLPTNDLCQETLRIICSKIEHAKNIILLLDGEFIENKRKEKMMADKALFQEICRIYAPVFHSISYSSSSFPRSVVNPGYGYDEYGCFELPETLLFDELLACKGTAATCYSDYATVHPLSYPGGAGGWVPRVDFPRGTDLFYYRYRRDVGGYVRAASSVKADEKYVNYGDWGCNEIEQSAAGTPQGKSPAHWISVRMSLHMARQVERLKAIDSGLEL